MVISEKGPCKFEDGPDPIINPFSWNNNVNMLYIDQPLNVGFSYGVDGVNSTESAAPHVWNLLQAFYASFPLYNSRELGISSVSYGGHYGPEFALYIQQQNQMSGGEYIDLVALGIDNGWHDAIIQYPANINFAHNNSYQPWITTTQYEDI
jgi:carboxypeptidase C (cathepsin A)